MAADGIMKCPSSTPSLESCIQISKLQPFKSEFPTSPGTLATGQFCIQLKAGRKAMVRSSINDSDADH
jgi:hypothetical protein